MAPGLKRNSLVCLSFLPSFLYLVLFFERVSYSITHVFLKLIVILLPKLLSDRIIDIVHRAL